MVPNRREMMIGGAALLATAAAVGSFAILGNRYGLFGDILRRNLPGVPLPDAELRKFADAYWEALLARRGRRRAALWQAAAALDGMLPGDDERTAKVERDVLTQFLMGSNFFQLTDPKVDEIEFVDLPSACPNPFYRT